MSAPGEVGAAIEFPISIAEWDRNEREVVRVALDQYRGCNTIDLRNWFRAADGELRPTKSGLTLSLKHLPALADALERALAKARELRLLPIAD
jgi:hypothetical protein